MNADTRNSLFKATVEFQEALNASHLAGPKTDEIKTFLARLKDRLAPLVTGQPPTEDKPRKARAPRPAPAGMFTKRQSMIHYMGKTFPCDSIAKGVCKVFEAFSTIDDKALAAAVQAAYPANNYAEYRVAVDRKKWQAKAFAFQQQKEA